MVTIRPGAFTGIVTLLLLNGSCIHAMQDARPVDFGRDIRPILSDNCFTCHGPDEQTRVTALRLDDRNSAVTPHQGRAAIVPGKLAESELFDRITTTDPERRMPPSDSGRTLSESQKRLLREWIEQGAQWQEHWAFVAPERPSAPSTNLKSWSRNPIDDFVLSRLENEGLQPSAKASRETLIRRLSLDVIGLPPTAEEVQQFVADTSPTAYEKLVDRLFSSPSYGEHMAVRWLDAARYADTSGYQNDGPRSMWRWRDWVIDAFNSNMTFDQFTIEQLAGDLLNHPTASQRIATAFNRNHRGNAEGGIIPEEYQVEYVVDRVDTTFTVWLGLTMGCARCHDHKYDPIRQKEFYQAFAYFNNIPESGRAIKEGNSPPLMKAPLPEQLQQLALLDQDIMAAESRIANRQPELNTAMQEWEANLNPETLSDWAATDDLVSHLAFNGNLLDSARNCDTESIAQPGVPAPTAAFASGPLIQAVQLNGESFVQVGDVANFGYFDKFSVATWFRAESDDGTLISRMTPIEEGAGYSVQLKDGRLQVNLIKRWLDDAIRVESSASLPQNQWLHLAVTYDGTRLANGIRVYIDGKLLPMDVKLDRLNQTFSVANEPLRIGGGQSTFSGAMDDVRVYKRDLSFEEVQVLALSDSVSDIVRLPKDARTDVQQRKLMLYYIAKHASDVVRNEYQLLNELRVRRRTMDEALPTVMVMEEMPTPRDTHILIRGQYDHPGEKVEPGVPSVFPPLPTDAPNNRLGFARWLVSPEHPLTSRVAVNRFWQHFFGKGLVGTSEDFGSQGEIPSHPELLDWLATEFVRLGWDMKALQKLIVTSSTYRQSSVVSPELYSRDPDNRLLARGSRQRLPAETLRDQALFVSGLLTQKLGGPSVKPYQPDGLWQEIATDTDYVQSHGEDLYRRSLYSYLKRTVAPPTMVTFDATSRESCVVQRSRTNTPLQSLALMNDITFVEAARVLAQRAMTEAPRDPDEQIRIGFVTATGRPPKPKESVILKRRYLSSLELFRADPVAAENLSRSGEYALDEELNRAELAALTTVTSVILNLDEVVSRE